MLIVQIKRMLTNCLASASPRFLENIIKESINSKTNKKKIKYS